MFFRLKRSDYLSVEAVQTFLPVLSVQFAFPHHEHFPSGFPQLTLLLRISFLVAHEFLRPEFDIGFRRGRLRALVMRMPEAAIDEDDGMPTRQHHIRMPGIPFVVFTESQAFGEEKAPYKTLNTGILPVDA